MNDEVSNGVSAGDEALRRSEERYRALVEATSQAVWSWSPEWANGDFEHTQRWWEEITGQTIEQQQRSYTAWLEVVHPHDRETAGAAWGKALETGMPYDVEYRVRSRDGTWRYIHARGISIPGPNGSIREWVGTLDDVTDRRRAEAENQRLMREVESERLRLAEVFQHAPSFTCVLRGPGHIFERANDRYLDLLGRRDIIGLTVRQAIPEAEGQGFVEILDRVYRTGESYLGTGARILLWRSGVMEERILDFVYQPLRDVDGAVSGIIVQGIDLTERRRVEEELRAIEERAAAIIDSFTDGFIAIDRDWRVTYVNAGAEEILAPLRKSRSNLLGKHFWEEFPEAVGTAFEQTYRRAMSERVTAAVEAFYSPLGRWIDVRIYPSRDGISLYFLDATDRKLAEEDRARLAAIVESSDDAIVSKTLDGVIRSWNTGAQRLFGHTPSEAVGRHITLIIPPERQEEEREILKRIRAGERVDHFETVRVAKDGRLIDISLTVSPILDREGRVVGASKVARDISERKLIDEALREADRKKDEFIALLAHELRNPLAPIRNGLQVLRLAAGDANAVAQARDMMDRQLTHMVRLVDDLLDVSRINQNKMDLRRSRVLLADVVSSAVETARPMIDTEGHDLTVSLPQNPVHLDADLTRLAQVFSNLLTNSAKYTPRGGRIWLSAERRGDEVAVFVRDTGIGIPLASLENIFDMFSQVDRSVERSTGGLGIGLALVKGLVEMHGGTVAVTSEGESKGSTFTVTLPVTPDHKASPGTCDVGLSESGPKRRILVVDDNRDGADSLAMMLRLLGNDVLTAHDGVEAVERAESFRPEVILMDVGMPRLNGLEAARRIREQPWGKLVTIIALTGWGQDGDKERSRDAGCDGHLVKPVNLPDLEKVLGSRR